MAINDQISPKRLKERTILQASQKGNSSVDRRNLKKSNFSSQEGRNLFLSTAAIQLQSPNV